MISLPAMDGHRAQQAAVEGAVHGRAVPAATTAAAVIAAVIGRRLAVLAVLLAPALAAATACTVNTGLMAFGIYDTVAAAPSDTTALLSISCTPGFSDPLATTYTLTVAGTGTGGDTVRSISAGAAGRLYFQVYKDAARSLVWGNGAGSGSGITASVTAIAPLVPALALHTAYARMPALQSVPPGLYAGTLLVTIEY